MRFTEPKVKRTKTLIISAKHRSYGSVLYPIALEGRNGLMPTYIGHRLGQYNLVKLIGHGGFADVYEAYDCFLKRRVAIKVLYDRFTQENFHAFLREAQTLARLDNPHIVKVIEFNIHGHIPYLVME